MPPKINTRRTNVSSEFIDVMCSMYAAWMTANQSLIQRGVHSPTFRPYSMTARRLLPIVRHQSPGAREGLDYEITRLHTPLFTDFLVIDGPMPSREPQDGDRPIKWLVGRTKHVQATVYNHRTEVAGELGRYDIYIPETIAVKPDLRHVHMIPQRHQLSVNRHYHHYLYNVDTVTRHPLTYITGNCWGDYEGPIKSLIDVPDYPELFRQLFGHLSTFGDRPPRTRLDFDVHTPEA